jgi:long-subunit fatty acid transport protein
MNLFNKKTLVALSAATGCLVSLNAYSAGLEKNVNWSGKYNGVAGAATSSVSDSEGLFFNPAGLAGVEGKGDIHVNFSPTLSQFKGPVSSTQVANSKTGFSPLGGLTSAYRLDDSTVLGAGVFVSGGTQARFTDISSLGNGTNESSLKLIEGTIGAARKINDKISVGASWRIAYGQADLASVAAVAGSSVQLEFKDLSGWNFSSFRLGAQYRDEDLGIGINIRTPVNMSMKGETGYAALPLPVTVVDSNTTVKAVFPLAISLGSDYKVNSRLKLLGDFSYTNYSANKTLKIDTNPASAGPVQNGVFAALKAAGGIPLNWHDLYIGRLGAEYKLQDNLVLRGGYALISAVTNKDFAKATFSSPGLGHSLTLGAGSKFGNLEANAAFDYSFASGHSDGNGTNALAGDYKSQSYTAHLGVAYSY